jgi:hypothetical protein
MKKKIVCDLTAPAWRGGKQPYSYSLLKTIVVDRFKLGRMLVTPERDADDSIEWVMTFYGRVFVLAYLNPKTAPTTLTIGSGRDRDAGRNAEHDTLAEPLAAWIACAVASGYVAPTRLEYVIAKAQEVAKSVAIMAAIDEIYRAAQEVEDALESVRDDLRGAQGTIEEMEKAAIDEYNEKEKIEQRLETALDDRERLLRHAGISDRDWSTRGGACWAELGR